MTSETVHEEYFENEPTGVEVEEDDDDVAIREPWNPDDIRVSSQPFSLRNILDMIEDDDLDLAPDFQRQRVWSLRQKSSLIESVLLRIPLPAFYFAEEKGGMLRVVDGLQRLSTIYEFTRGDGFALAALEYLEEVEGDRYDDLATSWRRRLLNTQINAHVIDPQTPDTVKFDIFKRINTGGTPLNAQEIRHCMSGSRSREFLKVLVALPEFQTATGAALEHHIRMVDREVALRFLAFYFLEDIEEYREYDTMDAFLTMSTRQIDEGLDPGRLQSAKEAFKRALKNAHRVFGEHAFRKWPHGGDYRRSPINRALFESWSVALSEITWTDLKPSSAEIVARARERMTTDADYIASISVSTGDPRRVAKRFAVAREIVEEATT